MRTIQEITYKFGMKPIPLGDVKVGDTVVIFVKFYLGYLPFSYLPVIYTVTRKTPAGTKITVTDKTSGAENIELKTKGLSLYTYDKGIHDFITDIKFRGKLYSFYRGYVQQALSAPNGQDLPRGVVDKCMRLLCDYFLNEPTDKLKELEEVKDTFVNTITDITDTLIDRADVKWGDS